MAGGRQLGRNRTKAHLPALWPPAPETPRKLYDIGMQLGMGLPAFALAGSLALSLAGCRELGDCGRLLELCDRPEHLAHQHGGRGVLEEIVRRRRRHESDTL